MVILQKDEKNGHLLSSSVKKATCYKYSILIKEFATTHIICVPKYTEKRFL